MLKPKLCELCIDFCLYKFTTTLMHFVINFHIYLYFEFLILKNKDIQISCTSNYITTRIAEHNENKNAFALPSYLNSEVRFALRKDSLREAEKLGRRKGSKSPITLEGNFRK